MSVLKNNLTNVLINALTKGKKERYFILNNSIVVRKIMQFKIYKKFTCKKSINYS